MCRGLGLRNGRQENTQPCNCALRAIFRACYARFYDIATDEKHMSRLNVEPSAGRESVWGNPFATTPIQFDDLAVRSVPEEKAR